ncbi:MAG: OmpH family outer membrane protein [Prevotella sp.]|nr:OmpH family outer membrane protein [Prevotella sp.]
MRRRFSGCNGLWCAEVAMPDYAVAQQKLSDLRAQYNAELQRVEQDFNTKYEEFLEGQREFPETILRKRQTELKELLERNIAFKNESRRELEKAEAEVMAPLKERLNEVLNSIGLEHGFAVIVNTDANAAPFVHPLMGEDINQMITDALK